jgi:lipopolysaccharide transport system permease protein
MSGTTVKPLQYFVIKPRQGLLNIDLASIWVYRELMWTLAMRDVKLRYKQAALGIAWAVIQPAFAVLIFTLIFGKFAKIPTGGTPYAVFAFAAILPWTYFSEALRRSATSLVTDGELVRKVYFPRLVMPLSGVLSPAIDFFFAFLVFLALLFWYDLGLTWKVVTLPLFLGYALLAALSIGLWLAPLNVRFRDVTHTMPFLIQVWMYASPIVYPIEIVPQQFRSLYSMNPMVGVIEGFRWALLDKPSPDWHVIGVGTAVMLLLLFGGLAFFRRAERTLADVI